MSTRMRWWLVILIPACAHAPVSHEDVPAPIVAEVPPVDVNGEWDWSFVSLDGEGNERSERELWHLEARGAVITGYYQRLVRMVATDGRPFRCNQSLTVSKSTRVQVEGAVAGEGFSLRETGYEATSGPCDDGARRLLSYRGRGVEGNLRLEWAPGEGETLARHREEPPASEAPLPAPGPAGAWHWAEDRRDANGDELHESEDWSLQETDAGVEGYYDRRVIHQRREGVFECNHQDRYEELTRFHVHGQLLGERLSLVDGNYEATPSPCGNRLRRRDTYMGSISPDGSALTLSWGPGAQVLHRVESAK